MGHILAPPGEYDWTIGARRQWGLSLPLPRHPVCFITKHYRLIIELIAVNSYHGHDVFLERDVFSFLRDDGDYLVIHLLLERHVTYVVKHAQQVRLQNTRTIDNKYCQYLFLLKRHKTYTGTTLQKQQVQKKNIHNTVKLKNSIT